MSPTCEHGKFFVLNQIPRRILDEYCESENIVDNYFEIPNKIIDALYILHLRAKKREEELIKKIKEQYSPKLFSKEHLVKLHMPLILRN